MTEQAAYCYSMVIVPLYDTLGANACAFIVNQSKFFSCSYGNEVCFFAKFVLKFKGHNLQNVYSIYSNSFCV